MKDCYQGMHVARALVRTRIYRQARMRLGPITVVGLELVREEWGETRITKSKTGNKLMASLYNIASNRTHREYKSLGEGFFVETEVEGPGHAASDGEGMLREARIMLCPYPSRLLAVTVKYLDGSTETYRVPPDKEFYVYEGMVEAEKPWEYLLIEAEKCRRIVLGTEVGRRKLMRGSN